MSSVDLSGNKLDESEGGQAHSLNCHDQRKVLGEKQRRTAVVYNIETTGFNTTANRGADTQIAICLQARDYKGLSTGTQQMTTCMVCFSPINLATGQRENTQTASQQERTGDFQTGGKKEP